MLNDLRFRGNKKESAGTDPTPKSQPSAFKKVKSLRRLTTEYIRTFPILKGVTESVTPYFCPD